PAPRAGEEALVALVDEGRDAALGALARHLVEHAVAVEATPEQRRAADGDRGGDLAELLAEVVAGHEEVRRQLRIALETRVARQDEPPLLPRAAHQRPAREVRPVGDVMPQDPEPAREPAEHPVDREANAPGSDGGDLGPPAAV